MAPRIAKCLIFGKPTKTAGCASEQLAVTSHSSLFPSSHPLTPQTCHSPPSTLKRRRWPPLPIHLVPLHPPLHLPTLLSLPHLFLRFTTTNTAPILSPNATETPPPRATAASQREPLLSTCPSPTSQLQPCRPLPGYRLLHHHGCAHRPYGHRQVPSRSGRQPPGKDFQRNLYRHTM